MTSKPKVAFTIWVALILLALILAWRHVGEGGFVWLFASFGFIAYVLFSKIFDWFYSADARRLKAAWESFPELPGEHLRWHQTARGVSQIVARNGRVVATVEGLGLLFHPWTAQVLDLLSLDLLFPSLNPTSVTSAQTERWPSARATAMRWCPSST